MSISSNTAQTRELNELRNHLKWLDEERRKSSKKMAELEQRIAQQGRDLADRDHKIQELEWHVANFTERFERLPDMDTNVAGTEQRLQDLEWHLSNMSGQLARLPNADEERARLQEDIARAIATSQERVETSQVTLENRLRTEMISLRESDEHRLLAVRQDQQAQAINEMDQQFAALQESVGILSGQLRERTTTLAAESQANFSSLAAGLQEQLDVTRAEYEGRFDLLAAQLQARLDEMVATESDEPSPDFLRLNDQLTAITTSQQQWHLRWSELEQQNQSLEQTVVELGQRNEMRDRLIDELNQRYEQIELKTMELAQGNKQIDLIAAELAKRNDQVDLLATELAQRTNQVDLIATELAQRTNQVDLIATELAQRTNQVDLIATELAQRNEQFEVSFADLAQRSDQTEQKNAQLEQLHVQFEQKNNELGRQLEMVGRQYEDLLAQFEPLNIRQVELEDNLTKLGHVREIMPLLDRLEQELELRQAEEVRLSNLIGTQENRFAPLATSLEEIKEMTSSLFSRLSDSERTIEELRITAQDVNDNWKPALSELNRRNTSVLERLTVLNNNVMKAEAGVQSLSGDHSELREIVVNLTDDMHRNHNDIARQLDGWQATLDENKDTIERFTQQWITLSNQYKEARMAVQNFAHWQKQLEQQKREASEMLRVESNRMQSRWDGFLLEIQEKLKNFEIELSQKWQAFEMENEQKWSTARRSEQLRHEELAAVDDLIQKLQQDNRNLIWRVQTAQADAIKKWPRLLMEEVEKAVEINPNRRLTTSTPPRADMSVVDAIEQGLITIDYNDDPSLDL